MSQAEKITHVWKLLSSTMRDRSSVERITLLSWLLLLKFLDYYETTAEAQAIQKEEPYIPIIKRGYRWSDWVPLVLYPSLWNTDDGSPVWNDEALMEFIHQQLFPYLSSPGNANSNSSIRNTLSNIFSQPTIAICDSAHTLQELLRVIDCINFHQPGTLPAIASAYGELLKQMNISDVLARDIFTPLPLVRFMVEALNPQESQRILDPACGAGIFLLEAYRHMQGWREPKVQELQTNILYGNAMNCTNALLCATNMALAGGPIAHIYCDDTFNLYPPSDSNRQIDIMLGNPPFGIIKDAIVKQRNVLRTNHNEPLFLRYCIDNLSPHAYGAVLVTTSALDKTSNDFVEMRRTLLEACRLIMVIDLPEDAFAPYTSACTSLLLFQKVRPAQKSEVSSRGAYTTGETLYYAPLQDSRGNKKEVLEQYLASAQDAWRNYRKGIPVEPSQMATSWIEKFDASTFHENNYRLGTRRPITTSRRVLPQPVELVDLLLMKNTQFHQIASDLWSSYEFIYPLIEYNQRFQQIISRIHSGLTEKEE